MTSHPSKQVQNLREGSHPAVVVVVEGLAPEASVISVALMSRWAKMNLAAAMKKWKCRWKWKWRWKRTWADWVDPVADWVDPVADWVDPVVD